MKLALLTRRFDPEGGGTERALMITARYLLEAGYKIYPVAPTADTILGQPAYASLADLPEPPDVVEVFSHPEAVPEIAREAAASKATVLWLQEGGRSDEGLRIACAGGLNVVMDRCMEKEHQRLVKEH